jgi:hypothetical protein
LALCWLAGSERLAKLTAQRIQFCTPSRESR